MMTKRFFNNPDFLNYVRLLWDLHAAIREGKDELEDGESIRERMDGPGSRLSPEEMDCVNGISADFYSLTEVPPRSTQPKTAELQADLAAAANLRDSEDYPKALHILRSRSAFIAPAELAYQRGQIWKKAGEGGIASLFLRRAVELDPNNSMYHLTAFSEEINGLHSREASEVSDHGIAAP